jgi:hypothetical protein
MFQGKDAPNFDLSTIPNQYFASDGIFASLFQVKSQ